MFSRRWETLSGVEQSTLLIHIIQISFGWFRRRGIFKCPMAPHPPLLTLFLLKSRDVAKRQMGEEMTGNESGNSPQQVLVWNECPLVKEKKHEEGL